MTEKKDANLECNKMILNFYSSQLSTHGRLVIGFAALLFTVSQVALGVSELFTPLDWPQYWSIVFGMFFTSLAFSYVLMRLLVYGVFANCALHIKLDNFTEIPTKILERAHKTEKILAVIPVSWFISVGHKGNFKKRLYGILLCCFPSFVITFALLLTLRLTTIQLVMDQINNLFQFI